MLGKIGGFSNSLMIMFSIIVRIFSVT